MGGPGSGLWRRPPRRRCLACQAAILSRLSASDARAKKLCSTCLLVRRWVNGRRRLEGKAAYTPIEYAAWRRAHYRGKRWGWR